MTTSSKILVALWEFARGDTRVQDFEQWLYSSPQLEAIFGDRLYSAVIETDFRSREAVHELKKHLTTFAAERDQSRCLCVRHPNLAIVDMGHHEEFFSTLKTTHERGDPFWWLFAVKCDICGQNWLVAAEERQNDLYILRRLSKHEVSAIDADFSWPSDFDHYETLLRIGREAGREDPAKERPFRLG